MLQLTALLTLEQDAAQQAGRRQRLYLADDRVQGNIQRCFLNSQFKDTVLRGPERSRAIACREWSRGWRRPLCPAPQPAAP